MRSGISSRAKLLDGQRFDYGFQATGLNSETIRAESKKNLNVEMANESSNRQPDGMGTNMDSATSDGQWAEIELRPSGDAIARLSKLILSKDERIKEILPAAAVAVAASVAVVAIFRMRKPK